VLSEDVSVCQVVAMIQEREGSWQKIGKEIASLNCLMEILFFAYVRMSNALVMPQQKIFRGNSICEFFLLERKIQFAEEIENFSWNFFLTFFPLKKFSSSSHSMS
jgi:hypothetical protein